MEWTDEKTFDLISLYEQNHCLYDVADKSYHNRFTKKNELNEVAVHFTTTGMFLKLHFCLLHPLYLPSLKHKVEEQYLQQHLNSSNSEDGY